ncbi:hypothetical protein [Sphingobacterium faecium]|uniref:hypothetical protein n=1 Tax=Sphingobacterium faecium TaxID=34087 RepID=UPI00143A47BB|nr:hypothetical protein [Sphingobacterium faecium]UXD67732.1 hypothetical protein MUK51_10865 [Sphingobacterium faecium]WGQ15560.1 hypothetical protein QG727_03930 [Sphingobacterium faecium]
MNKIKIMGAWGIEEKKEVPAEVTSLYRFALQNNCWIYYDHNRVFYTPEEFMDKWRQLYKQEHTGLSNIKDFAVKSPYAAIKQRAGWIKKANEELQALLEKLEGYDIQFKPPK